MSTKDDGGPAYPHHETNAEGDIVCTESGMSLRDAFAKEYGPEVFRACVDGMIEARPGETAAQCVAREAYALADAMLNERAK